MSLHRQIVLSLFSAVVVLIQATPAHSILPASLKSSHIPVETRRFDGFPIFANQEDAYGVSSRNLASDEDFDDFDEFGGEDGEAPAPVYDPLEGYNRAMFKFNDGFYDWVLKPMAKGWRFIAPQPVRVAIAKVLNNLLFPLRFVNNLLQLKFTGATTELGRFVVNTTLGIGGIFDPADHYFRWLPHDEDFGQTLAFYGVGEGFPLVLPFLGHSTLRDSFGILPNYLTHPVYHVAGYEAYLGTQAFSVLNLASLRYEEYDSIKRDALDPYTFLRDAYTQNRLKQIQE